MADGEALIRRREAWVVISCFGAIFLCIDNDSGIPSPGFVLLWKSRLGAVLCLAHWNQKLK